MAGRHSKRRGVCVRTPEQRESRRTGIDLVGAVTRVTHRVSPDELVAGHQRGDYVAFCGARFCAASLVEPGRGQCELCREHLS
jgi:hypothetical protein